MPKKLIQIAPRIIEIGSAVRNFSRWNEKSVFCAQMENMSVNFQYPFSRYNKMD